MSYERYVGEGVGVGGACIVCWPIGTTGSVADAADADSSEDSVASPKAARKMRCFMPLL
jgi:hypothetical protein